MRALRTVVLLVVALLLALPAPKASAKEDTLFDFGVTYVGRSENKDSDVDTKVQRTIVTGKASYGFPVASGAFALLFGAEYSGQFVDYQDFAPTTIHGQTIKKTDLPKDLHALDLFGTVVWNNMTENWSAVLSFKPGVHAEGEEFGNFAGRDWVYTGTLLFTRGFGASKKNQLGLGAYYGDLLGKKQVLPLVRVNWYPDERWFLEMTLPSDLDVGYRLTPAASVGLEGRLRGYQYRLSSDPWDHGILKYSEVRVGLFGDYTFWGKAHARLSAGVVPSQTFELRNEDGKDKLQDGDFKPSAYGTLNLYYTF